MQRRDAGRGPGAPSGSARTPSSRRVAPPPPADVRGWAHHASARSLRRFQRLERTLFAIFTLVGLVGVGLFSGGVLNGNSGAAGEPSCVASTLVNDGATTVYPLDDASGRSATDDGANHLTATIYGTSANAYDVTPGPLPCAPTAGTLEFNGRSTSVTTPITGNSAAVTGTSLTVVAWVKASSFSPGSVSPMVVAADAGTTTAAGFQLALAGNGQGGSFDLSASDTSDSAAPWHQALSAGTWYMVAGTYDGSTVTSYVDGVAAGIGTAGGAIDAGGANVTIGDNPVNGDDQFDGQIGDVALLPSALSAAQLQALYLAGQGDAGPPCADPALIADGATALYPLANAAGAVAADISGHGQAATIANAASYDDTPGPLGCAAQADGALGFDGSSTHVTTPLTGSTAALTGSTLTVMAWAKPATATPGAEDLVADADPARSTKGISLDLTPGGGGGSFEVATAGSGDAAAAWGGPSPLSTVGWQLVVGTYNGHTLTTYLDGAQVASAPAAGPLVAGTSPLSLGYDPAGGGAYFKGQLADVAVLPVALSAAQVSTLYQAGAGTTAAAAWHGTAACGQVVTATPPAGAYSATVTVNGAGGGGGGGGGLGASGSAGSGTVGVNDTTGKVSAQAGCGGGAGAATGGGGGGGYASGGSGGSGSAGGGGGGGASALCLGADCSSPVVVAAGGGGGGAHLTCTTGGSPGTGGSGGNANKAKTGKPATNKTVTSGSRGANGDGGTGGKGGGGGSAASAGGGGSAKDGSPGASGANTPSTSFGGGGGAGGATAGTGGGGGGGGFTGGGGGGGNACSGGADDAGGGGGGSTAAAGTYDAALLVSGEGGQGGAAGAAGAPGTVSLTWNVADVSFVKPVTQTTGAGATVDLPVPAGDSAGLGLTYLATGLPPGLSVAQSTGTISGTPTTAGTYTVTLRAADTQGASSTTGPFTWNVTSGPPAANVSAAGGTATASPDHRVTAPTPTISSFTPRTGTTGGGTTVTMTGSGLLAATAVKFGGTTAFRFTVITPTKVTAVPAHHARGAVTVKVATAGGTATASSDYRFVASTPTPTITSFTPAGSGPFAATTIRFEPTTAFGLTVTTPTKVNGPHAPGTLRTTTTGGRATADSLDGSTAATPSITSFTPISGPSHGGTTVTITGTDLAGTTAVAFGATTAASFTVTSPTQVTAVTEGHAAGTVAISVTTADGTATSASDFAFVGPVLHLTTSGTPSKTEVGTGYVLTLSPSATGPAYNYPRLVVTLPGGETFATTPTATGWACIRTDSTATLSCTATTLSTLPTFTVTVAIASTASPGPHLTAGVLSDTADSAVPASSSATVTVTAVPVLHLALSGTPPSAVAGAAYTLTISPSMSGTAYHPPYVTVTLEPGETFTSDPSPTGWNCTLSSGTAALSCTATTKATLGTVTVPVAIATTATPGTYSTVATLADAGDGATPAVAAASVTVTPAPATQLAFHSVPVSVGAGGSFNVTVWAESSSGHLVTSGTGNSDHISLAGSTLSCTSGLTTTAHGGVATFTGCTLTSTGGQAMTASDTSHGETGVAAAIATVTVTPGTPSKLVFIAPPSSVTAGTSISLTVRVEDHYDNRVTSGPGATDTITLDGAHCTTNTLPATSGEVTFTDCALPTTAGEHTVTASDPSPGRTGVAEASRTIDVEPGPAAALAFTNPPSSVTVGQPFPLTVLVVDSYDNRVRTGSGSTDSVAVAGSSITCTSGTTATASAGSALFEGCTLGTPPSATLKATDTTTGDTTFTPATVTVTVARAPTKATLTSSANAGTVGTPVTYTAKVKATLPSQGVPAGDVEFEADDNPIAGCTAQPLTAGSATCTVTYELLTVQMVTAHYLGTTPGYSPSTSSVLSESLMGNGLAMSESANGTNPNPSTVELSPVTLNGVPTLQSSTGVLNVIHVADNRGTAAGWTVTAQLEGNFNNNDPKGNVLDNVIPADNLLWAPSIISGSATGVLAGPAAHLSKTVANTLCDAPSGHGAGGSSCSATLKLVVPPTVASGHYTTVIDIVIS